MEMDWSQLLHVRRARHPQCFDAICSAGVLGCPSWHRHPHPALTSAFLQPPPLSSCCSASCCWQESGAPQRPHLPLPGNSQNAHSSTAHETLNLNVKWQLYNKASQHKIKVANFASLTLANKINICNRFFLPWSLRSTTFVISFRSFSSR